MTKQASSFSSSKWTYAFTIIFVLLIINTGIFTIVSFNIQNQLYNLQTELIKQERQIKDLQQQVDILNYINQTNFMPWPENYNHIKHSVVLIQTEIGLASGFVYDYKGHIITNYHVIEDATTVQVTFLDGNVTIAEVTGEDPYSDLAVIKVDPNVTTLHPVVFGNSSDLTVGEPVAAIGNPFGLSDTITVGIVSALGRELSAPGGYLIIDVIQVDAAINPGNSGGPLINVIGQVVGMNTAIITATGTFAGIGFAIPSATLERELAALIANGTYIHPWIGVSGVDVNFAIAQYMQLEKPQGFLLINVVPGSPADQADLQGGKELVTIGGQEILIGGDVIVKIDNQTVRKGNDLLVYMERYTRPGDQVTLTIIRNNTQLDTNLILGERPPPT